jgi:hypothetical protein
MLQEISGKALLILEMILNMGTEFLKIIPQFSTA